MKLNDLMTSETTIQEPTYSGGLDFNVISAVEEEKKSAKDVAREKLTQHLKNRSDLRKAIRSGEKSSGNKDVDNKTVNTSTLADTFTDVMVSLGKDPAYMQEKYGTNEGNIELINKMKGLQGGKFSGDIQNYIDGKATDLTGLVNNMFPDYIAAKTGTPTQVTTEEVATQPVKREEADVLKGDTRSGWDKMAEGISQFRWSDIGLESERRPLKPVIEFGAGIYDDLRKVVPGIKSIANSLTMDKPEDFAKKIDGGMYKNDYAYDKEHGYTGSYNQWKQDMKDEYEEKYNKETSLTKEIDKNKGDMRFNLVDEESNAFKGGELASEIGQQILLDKWMANALKRGYRGYKALRGAKNVAKGTGLSTRGTELALEGTEGLANPQTMQESKNIANRIIDWYNKGGKTQDLVKAGAEGGKAGLEYQLIGDVQDGQLSDAQAYGMSAGLGTILGTIFDVFGKGVKNVSEPGEGLKTSLKRLGVQDVDDVVNWAEVAAKDHTLPSAKQRVTDDVIAEAKKNVKDKLDSVGQDLGNFRKKLGWSDLTLEGDFINPINKALSEKNVGAKIIKQDGKYVVEGFPKGYGDILNKVTDSLNSLEYSVKEKMSRAAAGEEVDFLSDVGMVEDLLSDLKGYSIVEKNPEIKQKFIEIEQNILDNIKKGMSPKQASEYEGYLNDYAKNKFKMKKVNELEGVMNKGGIADQPKMSDGQYLSDFLEELYSSDKAISKNAKDRRIVALFADAIYGVPLKPGEKVPYPTKYGWLEEAQRRITKLVNLPKNKITGGWRSYAGDYKPSATRSALKKGIKQAKTTTIGKMAEQPREE